MRRGGNSSSSIPSPIRATANTGSTYHKLTERNGVTPEFARVEMRRTSTLIGAMLIHKGEADGMLCGMFGALRRCTCDFIDDVIGLRPGVQHYAAMNVLMLPGRTVFICDTYVNADPTPSRSPR